MSFIRWITRFLIAVIVIIFAVSNRHSIMLYIIPTEAYTFELPLYAIGLGMLAFGFFFGSLTVWLNASQIRRIKRKQKKQIKNLEKALETMQEDKKIQIPALEFFPKLSKSVKK